MKLATATATGALLFAASLGLLAAADEAVDLLAIAGGIGVVISAALLGLTMLTWRWRRGTATHVTTRVVGTSVYDELDGVLDPAAAGEPPATPAVRDATAV